VTFSINIDIKNIDMKSIHDTNPLDQEQIDFLMSIGYKYENAIKKDQGDYKKIFSKEKMEPKAINSAISLYPELAGEDLSKWTNGDFDLYIQQKNEELYSPTKEQEKELKRRGIVIEDAQYLLEYFYTYDNFLLQSNETLKDYLEKYYQFKISYVDELKSIETKNKEYFNNNDITIMVDPPIELQGTTYRYVEDFPNYQDDWFHVDSDTHVSSNKYWYGDSAANSFSLIYGSSTPIKYSNLWGTYSGSQNGAHEGIDFVGPDQHQLKSPVGGEVIYKADEYIVVYDTENFNYNFSFFFYHMSDVTVNQEGTLNIGDIMGRQSDIGNAKGSHLHFAVENGYDTTTTSAKDDHNLDSASPYIFW